MTAFLIAVNTPYFAQAGADGRFTIGNVPPGSYRLHVWHEGWSRSATDVRGRPTFGPPIETEEPVSVDPSAVTMVNFRYNSAPAVVVERAPAPPAAVGRPGVRPSRPRR